MPATNRSRNVLVPPIKAHPVITYRSLLPSLVAQACGANLPRLPSLVVKGESFKAPPWLMRYGLYAWAKTLEG